MVFASPEVIVGDELRLYYGAWRKEHSAGSENDGAIGLATLRLDGFVSLKATDRCGTIVTKPFNLQGRSLQVNADADKGELRVEILDQTGKQIEGFAAADCRPITRYGLRHNVTWSAKKQLGDLKGKTIRLMFVVKDAELYSFRFVD